MRVNPAFFLIASAVIIWGATAPIMKWSLENIPLFSLAFLRFFLATFLLLPFVYQKMHINPSDWPKLIIASFLGIGLNITLFFLGLKLTFAINAALIIAAIPIFTMLAALLFLNEKLSLRIVLSSIVATIGLLLIIGPPVLSAGPNHLLGGLLLVGATLSWVGYEVVSKRLLLNYSPLTITFHSVWIGALTFLPLAGIEYIINPAWVSSLDVRGVVGVLYGALFSSTIAYSAWGWGLSKIEASEAAFFFYLDPISGVLVATFLLGEKITPLFILGALLIAGAMFLAEHQRKVHPIYEAPRLKGVVSSQLHSKL